MSNALIQYFYPKLYLVYANTSYNFSEIRKLFFYYAGLMVAGTIVVIIFIYIVYIYFLNVKYVNALSYIYLICAGYFTWCITYFFYSFLLYKKEKKKLFVLSAGNIIISLLSNYYFIGKGGAYGAALSICITYAMVFIYTLFITRDYVKGMFAAK